MVYIYVKYMGKRILLLYDDFLLNGVATIYAYASCVILMFAQSRSRLIALYVCTYVCRLFYKY